MGKDTIKKYIVFVIESKENYVICLSKFERLIINEKKKLCKYFYYKKPPISYLFFSCFSRINTRTLEQKREIGGYLT